MQGKKETILSENTRACVFLKLKLSRLGDKRGVSSDDIEVDADKDFVKVRKVIFKSAAFDCIRSLDGKIRRYVRDECFPFEQGMHMVPVLLVEKIETQLMEFYKDRQVLVDHFAKVFPQIVENAPEHLRKLHNESDYNVGEVANEFYMSWQFLAFTAPLELESVSSKIFQEERHKMQSRMEEAYEEARYVLRETCLELVKNLRERLEPDQYGAPKRFSATTLRGLQEFVNSFELRNITNDAELETHIRSIKRIVSGVDIEELKTTDGLRARVRAEMATIEVQLDESIEVAPKRRIRTSAA